jgi:hypothetical protein
MKSLLVLAIVFTGALAAQEGEKVRVPLTDPGRAARVHAHLISGGIYIHGGSNNKEVIVALRSRSGEDEERHERPAPAAGMKRLRMPGNAGLEIDEDDNLVNIKTSPAGGATDLDITVPRRSSLQLKCLNDGDIRVEQVDGEIEADNLNGKITLINVSGSVLAHSLNGAVFATLDRIDPSKPMSFSTLNGDIDVTLPDNVRANVRMKTDNGEIYSDFDVKLDAGSHVETNEGGKRQDGRYHLRFDRTLRGSINNGGPEFQFTSFNGQIYIRKRK